MRYDVGSLVDINQRNIKKSDKITDLMYLDTSNLTEGSFNKITYYDLTKDNIPSRAKRKVQQNDILISTVRPNQKHYGFVKEDQAEYIVSTGFAVLTPKDEVVDPYYLYKFLTLDRITNQLQMIAENSTSAYPSIKPDVIASLEINLPKLSIQKRISKFLKTIDNKIELNNSIISNLEELAQTLFKRWFVDFEFPNENGEPYKSSGGKMVESELGMIPEGWEVNKLENQTTILRGASPRPIKDYIQDRGIPWVKISDANSSSTMYLQRTMEYIKLEGKKKSREVEPGKLILSNSATPGIPMIMNIYACVHDGWLIFDGYKELSKEYIYLFLKQEREKILTLSNGSVFRNLKTGILKSYPIIIPDKQTLSNFQMQAEKINDKILSLDNQNITLSNIRDSLLPKLLSGEIELPDESEVTEDVPVS